ncbi:MAG TPA: ABC transporter substrate-binding protein [Acetobacteraceae bacterium]|nr:ABC transporter substrate-binding protein [Acetobacteraceae bacterium]
MRIWCVLLLLAVATPALAQKSADTLRVSWRDAVPDVDPYYNSLRTGLVLAHQAWDTLIYRDPATFELRPQLATSWKYVNDTALEFTLRQGVTFQDGSPFSADDVVYTIETALHDPRVSVPTNFAFLQGAEKIDADHVRIRLKRVFPAALEYLAMVVPILPKGYRERVGAAAYAQAPIGTGPYRITRVDGTREIDLERYDGYFNGPKGRPAIRRIVIREVADANAELADLLGGRADWIWMLNPDALTTIDSHPELRALTQESMRIGYLSLDAAGRSGPDDPMKQLKVRQAIWQAIDRAAFVRQVVGDGARVLYAPCYPSQFGCDEAAAVRYPYDPAKARQLLADAGYPDGFKTELVSYILPQWSKAIAGYLQAIGIDARIVQLPTGQAVRRAEAGQAPLWLGSWGSYSINDVSAIFPYFFGGGPDDYARDPELEKLVQAGDATTDPDRRRLAYSQAIHRITAQAYWLPLNTNVTTYAMVQDLDFTAYPDELPRFFLAHWR